MFWDINIPLQPNQTSLQKKYIETALYCMKKECLHNYNQIIIK